MNFSIKKIIAFLLIFFSLVLLYLILSLKNSFDYLYPKIDVRFFLIGLLILTISYSLLFFISCLKIDKFKKFVILTFSLLLVAPLIILIYISRSLFSFYSMTENINDYLIVDEKCKADYSFFPLKDDIDQYEVFYSYYLKPTEPYSYEIRLLVRIGQEDIDEYIKNVEERHGTFKSNEIQLDSNDYPNGFVSYKKIIHNNSDIIYVIYCGYPK